MLHPAIFGNILCKYITVLLRSENYEVFLDDLSRIENEELSEPDRLLVLHLKARTQIQAKDYEAALQTLRSVIDSDTVPQRLLLYLSCADMEICCRETEDYKGAYEFSQNKIDLLEHMLKEF